MKCYDNRLLDIKKIKLGNNEISKLLIEQTNFLSNDTGGAERLWYVKNNIHEQMYCPVCKKNKVKIDTKKGTPRTCSYQCRNNRLEENGKTFKENIGLKTKQTKLTKENYYKEIAKKSANTKMGIFIKGIPLSKIYADKSAETMKKLDENGISIYQKSAKKHKRTLNSINKETGNLLKDDIKVQQISIMNKVDPETGLTKRELHTISQKKTMNKVDPETGLTKRELHTISQRKTKRIRLYENIVERTKDYKIINDFESFIISDDYLVKYKCNSCGSNRESQWPYIRCTKCYPYNKSIAEQEIYDYCLSLTDSTILSNDRQAIKPMELDIVIPDYNLAIEYNGLFWHSSDSVETESSDYHLTKTLQCKEQDIQLLHIFENEWIDSIKQNIWKSIIRNKLGLSERIHARKCHIITVDAKTKTEFLNQNHLQNNCSSSVNIGLEYNGELVSLMTFGKSRFNKKYEWELLRFCNKIDYTVVGGAGRLIKQFRKGNVGSIISYADMRRSDGNLYKQLGFDLSHVSKPNYWYIKYGQLESRVKYQKHKLVNILENYDSKLTESENMYQNGYRKIYDCGNQVWVIN